MGKKPKSYSSYAEENDMSVYEELKSYRRRAIIAANELMYGPTVVAKLKSAKSCNEISRIMKTARESWGDK